MARTFFDSSAVTQRTIHQNEFIVTGVIAATKNSVRTDSALSPQIDAKTKLPAEPNSHGRVFSSFRLVQNCIVRGWDGSERPKTMNHFIKVSHHVDDDMSWCQIGFEVKVQGYLNSWWNGKRGGLDLTGIKFGEVEDDRDGIDIDEVLAGVNGQ